MTIGATARAGASAAAAAALVAACGAPPEPAADATPADAAPAWATYVIEVGEHGAAIEGGSFDSPLAGVVDVAGRDYQLALDGSARYVLTAPVESNDQLDWNKLPGLSDCGTVDLSVDGAMFGWRWRPDLDPPVLELTAYANEAGVHGTAAAPLAVLDAADLDAAEPLRYRVWRDDAAYGFSIEGALRGRPVSAATTLPRRCAGERRDVLAWASGLYFGGTSTAPQRITARVLEQRFVPAP